MNKNKTFIKTILIISILVLTIYGVILATPPASPYSPGQTLNPACAPGTTNCTVIAPAISTRLINTTLPLFGGGDLSANRTLTIGGLSTLGAANQLVGVNPTATGWEYKDIFVTATGVGIGTTAPAHRLDVVGDVSWTGTLQGGSVPWPRLTTFPGACPAGQFVTAVGGTLTCAPAGVTWPLLATIDGTLTAPAYSWSADPDTGFFRQAADVIGFTTAGVERARLSAAGLDIRTGGLLTAGVERLTNVGALVNIASLNTHTIPTGTGILAVSSTAPITLSTAGAIGVQRADLLGTTNQIAVAGGAGILLGTTNATLTLPQDIHTGASPTFANLTATTSVITPLLTRAGTLILQTTATIGADDLMFQTAGAERMRILENGNVGIGTMTPTDILNIRVNAPAIMGGIVITGNEGFISARLSDAGTGDPGYLELFREGIRRFLFSPDLSYIATGNVGIGTTTPTERLNVVGNILGTGNLVVDGTINTGLGPTEVHLMNQHLRTTDSVTFTGLTLSGTTPLTLTGATSPITFQRNTILADILALDNIGAGGILSLNLVDGGLRTAGTERLTNAGALVNIASLNTHTIPTGTGILAVSSTAPITLSTAGAIGVQRADLLGTTNQIAVAGGAGILLGTTNAILSLPQNIHTGATPQFARMGLGVAADGTYLLNLGGALVHGTATGVGIGTTIPNASLHVSGSTAIFGLGEGGTPSAVTIRGPAASGINIPGANMTFDASLGTGTGGSGNIIFRTAPSDILTAISFDAASIASGSAGTLLSWSHTTSGSDRILIVSFTAETTGCSVSSATYAGSPMTRIDRINTVEMWFILAPAIGTNTITLNLSGCEGGFLVPSSDYAAGAHSYTGVSQSVPLGTSAIASGTGTTASVNVSSATGELVVDAVGVRSSNAAPVVGAGQTQRYSNVSNLTRNAGSSEPGATTVTMSWTLHSTTDSWGIIAVPLRQTGAPSSPNILTERLRITREGNLGIGTAAPGRRLDVLDAANPQLRITQASAVFGEFLIDSLGDLRIAATGRDIRMLDENLWVCAVGACPAPAGVGTAGNLIVEGEVFAEGVQRISCPAGMILVPPSPSMGLDGFCVDKFEAKNVGGRAVSEMAGTPWVSITQFAARAACIREGKRLISEREWLAIAHNIERVGWNWNGGVVGTNQMSDGHSDNVPASSLAASTDADPCFGTGEICSETVWHSQRRTYRLSNGATIWDFGGNVWEWVDQVNEDEYPIQNSPIAGWVACSTAGDGICGNTLTTDDQWHRGGTLATRGFLRGGGWLNVARSGAFALHLFAAPVNTDTIMGFRCAR